MSGKGNLQGGVLGASKMAKGGRGVGCAISRGT